MTLDLDDILRVLPHRAPMLLLDSVSLLEPPLRIEAARTLQLHVQRGRAWGRFWPLHGEARVAGDLVASATLLAALMPRPAPETTPPLPRSEADHAAH